MMRILFQRNLARPPIMPKTVASAALTAAMKPIGIVVVAAALSTLVACSGKQRIDPILQLSTAEALIRGKELMGDKKYLRAQRYLDHAFESSPNSREGREALLLAADSLFYNGGTDNFIRCEAKYRDFLNRFPTSDRSDYAQFQVGNCLLKRIEKPDRDQEASRKALDAFEELLRLYPTSDYVEDGQSQIEAVLHNLAESEYLIAHFYVRYRLCQAAINRLDGLTYRFPNYGEPDKALFLLARAFDQCGEKEKADNAYAKLSEQSPQSPYLGQVPKARKGDQKIAAKRSTPQAKGKS